MTNNIEILKAVLDPEAGIEWTGAIPYTTKKGKEKTVLTGIPGQIFWHTWKGMNEECRLMLRLNGFRLAVQKERVQRTTKEHGWETRSGPKTRTQKTWTAECWINRRNAALVESFGYALPVHNEGPVCPPEIEQQEIVTDTEVPF